MVEDRETPREMESLGRAEVCSLFGVRALEGGLVLMLCYGMLCLLCHGECDGDGGGVVFSVGDLHTYRLDILESLASDGACSTYRLSGYCTEWNRCLEGILDSKVSVKREVGRGQDKAR